LSRDDVRELIALITSLTPLDETVAAAIDDLQRREAALSEREARLAAREIAIKAALGGFSGANP
jgi:hypothetical protein